MVGVEQWAELRREHFVGRKSIKELARATGLSRNTIRRALRSETPPGYRRAPKAGVLEPFKAEIHRLLKADPKLPGVRVRELLEPLGFDGGKTVVDDYLREVRPLFAPPPRTFQRTVYRPGEICQFDVWQPQGGGRRSVTARRARRGSSSRAWATRARAPARWSSARRPRTCLAGIRRCLWSLGALPQTLVWDRQAGIHGHGGRPSEAFAAFCGQLRVAWRFCEPADPQAKGAVERLQGYVETNFEPGRRFANELDFQDQLDAWFESASTPGRTRRCAPARSTGSPRSAG